MQRLLAIIMYLSIKLILFVGIATPIIARPAQDGAPHIVHERRHQSEERWIKRETIEPSQVVPVHIALKQTNLEKGMDYLIDVSHPMSTTYGKHYTQDQIARLFAPREDTVASVRDWLVKHGIANNTISQPTSRGWLQFDTTLGRLEKILGTKYHYYESTDSDHRFIGCDEYSLPSWVMSHVDYVVPGVMPLRTGIQNNFEKRDTLMPRRRLTRPLLPVETGSGPLDTSACGNVITPACIKAMYGIPPGTTNVTGNSLGIFSFGSFQSQADLDAFFQKFSPNIPAGTGPRLAEIDGAEKGIQESHNEADLDFEMAIPLLYPQGTTVFQTDATQFTSGKGGILGYRDGLYNNFLDAIDGSYCNYTAYGETGDNVAIDPIYPSGSRQCGVYKPTNVISISYGLTESTFPANYQKRQCNEFMKLGLQGVSVVISSGDSGVAYDNGVCMGSQANVFVATYVDCPYVTLVGSTFLPVGSSPGDPEISTTSFSSGGGFSNIYPRPSYQDANVKSYFTDHDPAYPYYNNTLANGSFPDNGGRYNRNGRGYPDLAAVGDNGATIVNGKPNVGSGTSMSTPIVAAIFTRINEARITAGKGPIGFVNPTLYSHPEMFNDIIAGDQSQDGCGTKGFSAVPGWDPVSGMGTPKYDKMLEIFGALP